MVYVWSCGDLTEWGESGWNSRWSTSLRDRAEGGEMRWTGWWWLRNDWHRLGCWSCLLRGCEDVVAGSVQQLDHRLMLKRDERRLCRRRQHGLLLQLRRWWQQSDEWSGLLVWDWLLLLSRWLLLYRLLRRSRLLLLGRRRRLLSGAGREMLCSTSSSGCYRGEHGGCWRMTGTDEDVGEGRVAAAGGAEWGRA
jgi:hypothetical protein